MKIEKIINLCKRRGTLKIYEGEGAQWLSDGCALYPLFGLPYFDENSICAAYDITAAAAEKMNISSSLELPSIFDYSNDAENEAECLRSSAIFGALVPITTSHGIEFIQSKYLAPFADCDDNMLRIYERTNAAGMTYFAVKNGLMLVGFIMPYDCINEDFVKRLKDLAEQCEIALYHKKNEAAKREAAEE